MMDLMKKTEDTRGYFLNLLKVSLVCHFYNLQGEIQVAT